MNNSRFLAEILGRWFQSLYLMRFRGHAKDDAGGMHLPGKFGIWALTRQLLRKQSNSSALHCRNRDGTFVHNLSRAAFLTK